VLSNASVKRGLGGWCWTFWLWWQYSWDEIHPDIKQTLINEYIQFQQTLMCINVLELLGIFVTEVAIVVAHNADFQHMFQWQPLAKVGGNNLLANIWSGTKSMESEKARAITKLMSECRMQTAVGFKHPHKSGTKNIVADGFSPDDVDIFISKFKKYLQTGLTLLQQANLASPLLHLRRFHLNPEILSLMFSAILSPSTITLPKRNTKSCCVGNTLNNKLIRKAPIDKYLSTAIKYIIETSGNDPSIDPSTKKQHSLIDASLHKLKRWETVPNQRHPLTIPMIRWLKQKAEPTNNDSPEKAMVDWLIVGIHTGYRSVEWSQEKDPTKDGFYHTDNPDQSIYAICEEDITFTDAQGHHCHDKLDAHAVIFNETFRIQKNKEHGQIK
jgi:hypothetical protein